MNDIDPNVALPAGVYQHWKGPLYLVLGLAHDANADELYVYLGNGHGDFGFDKMYDGREVVVYVGLQLDAAHEGARLAVRTLADFFASVCVDKEHRHYGKAVAADDPCRVRPRFSYLGPRFVDGMQQRS